MAIASVDFTVESLAHMQRLLDAAIDDNEGDLIAARFKPIKDIIHYMVAGVDATWDAKTLTLALATPDAVQEAMKAQLDAMEQSAANSIKSTNTTYPRVVVA